MQGTLAGGGGLEGSIRRVLGVDYKQLSDLWQEPSRSTYLPEVAIQAARSGHRRRDADREASEGTLHLAPALSPDGNQVAYFSEKDFYFVDLYLADADDRQGQAAAAQVVLQQQLRDLPVHQLRGGLVARRQVPRGRGQAAGPGTTSSSSMSSQATGGATDQAAS